MQGEGIMAEVRVLQTVMDKEKLDAIEVLEDVLAEAKAGNVQSVAIAIVAPDSTLGTAWSSGGAGLMLGAMRYLESELIKDGIDRVNGHRSF